MNPGAGLEGRAVLVTGGSRGIGAAIARRLAALGARVAIGHRGGGGRAEDFAAELGAPDRPCIAVRGDVSVPAEIDGIVDRVAEAFGGIDVLVNCAAIAPYRPLGALDAAHIRAILDTNVLGTALMIQAALPHLAAPGGRIINIASALAYRPIPASSIYSASKAAVITLTHALAKELGPRGITVNAIAPGVIETDMTAAILLDRRAQILAQTPLGRIGQPDDIAGIVAFLASRDAAWITGRTIIADGGVT